MRMFRFAYRTAGVSPLTCAAAEAAVQSGQPIPYFFAQPSPASVSPFGRYSQPIQPA